METLTSPRLKRFEASLWTALQQDSDPAPKAIRCILQNTDLLVILDCVAPVPSQTHQYLYIIRRVLVTLTERYRNQMVAWQFRGVVKCYMRMPGQRRPFAGYRFVLPGIYASQGEGSLMNAEVTESPPTVIQRIEPSKSSKRSTPESSHASSSSSRRSHAGSSNSTSASGAFNVASTESAPAPSLAKRQEGISPALGEDQSQRGVSLSSMLAPPSSLIHQFTHRTQRLYSLGHHLWQQGMAIRLPRMALPLADRCSPASVSKAASKPKHSASSKPSSRPTSGGFKWPSPWLLGAGIGTSLVLVVTGIGIYAFTRPCVSGKCQVLEDAQQMNDTVAAPVLESTASFSDVAQTYETLLDVNYRLSAVPFWSPHYDNARSLLGTYEDKANVLAQVIDAQRQAKAAAAASQSPPHPLETWTTIEGQWQRAIQQLEPVAAEEAVSPLVQTKLDEYYANLRVIKQRIEQERAARSSIQSAREAVQIAEARGSVAHTLEEWQLVASTWQTALDRLAEVPEETMTYAEAEHLAALYQPQWLEANHRSESEQTSMASYNSAIALADQAVVFERESQWTLAVRHWKDALDQIQQVPENTLYYDQAQALIVSYSTALSDAQTTLAAAMSIQQAKQELQQQCDEASKVCQSIEHDTALQVWLTPDYDQYAHVAQQDVTTNGVKPSSSDPADLDLSVEPVSEVSQFLMLVAAVGKNVQLPIEVYDAEGTLFSVYQPDMAGYIQTRLVSTDSSDEMSDEMEHSTLEEAPVMETE